MYIAERGDLPHYQEVFSKFVLALERFDDTMSVYLYMRGEDYSNHFMLVRNLARAVQPLWIGWIGWTFTVPCSVQRRRLRSLMGLKSSGRTNSTIPGFCWGVSLTRVGTSGVAAPCMKPGTMQNATVLDDYAVLTEYIVTIPGQVDGRERSTLSRCQQSQSTR
jgi:hypothetical protein